MSNTSILRFPYHVYVPFPFHLHPILISFTGSYIICRQSVWRIETWRHRNSFLCQRIAILICYHLRFFSLLKNSCHKIIHVHAHISVGKVVSVTSEVSCGGYTEPAETKVKYHLVHVK